MATQLAILRLTFGVCELAAQAREIQPSVNARKICAAPGKVNAFIELIERHLNELSPMLESAKDNEMEPASGEEFKRLEGSKNRTPAASQADRERIAEANTRVRQAKGAIHCRCPKGQELKSICPTFPHSRVNVCCSNTVAVGPGGTECL